MEGPSGPKKKLKTVSTLTTIIDYDRSSRVVLEYNQYRLIKLIIT